MLGPTTLRMVGLLGMGLLGGALGCGAPEPAGDAGVTSPDASAPPSVCTPAACGRFAQCVDEADGARCLCSPGYQGLRCTECAPAFQDRDGDGSCEAACSPGVCPLRAGCDDSSGTIVCRCEPGYVLSGSECVSDGTVPTR